MSRKYEQLYDQLCQHARETALLAATESTLGWDERTKMPPEAAEYRAEQMTLLAGILHQRRTDPRVGQWLGQLAASPLAADPHSDTGTVIRQLKRDFDKRTKLPQSLVEELTRTASLGQHTWQTARANNNFALLEPVLEKTYELKRAQAEALGYEQHPYDALLDDFEPGELTSKISRVLAGLREALVPLVAAIADSGSRPDVSILSRRYPLELQEWFSRGAAAKIGFDFRRGRLDVTAHPFCTGLGPHDCRITTRYEEHFFNCAFFGTLHEAGHGIYDQGLPTQWYGLPPAEAVSLGIHESQSRLWENLVGRSRAFWEHFFPIAQQTFPAALAEESLDRFYFAINDVRPSLIRVEADEATYNLHILIRFELEQSLLADELKVADLPEAWNDKYEQALGIRPETDADGVLQDIHWSAGLVGYFPTYALGNLYASQLFAEADADLGSLAKQFGLGDFRPLREWLHENVYRHGQRYSATELVQKISGKPLSHDSLMAHLRNKLAPLYGLN
ncbi:MAG TPA: carboxypeptidase M32 [Pirellulales bacterium]|jgi:carboxypeptidase Taq|nr:carboxypeptidase M32 [Pirellulales bacterium]